MHDITFPVWPAYPADQVEAAASVIRSGLVNYWQGTEGRAFEAEYAAAVGVRHAVATANGTLALELALRSVGVGPGDEVIVPARTFIATVSSVVAVGATPVVADVDLDTGNISVEAVHSCITDRTKAVIVVHVGGIPCDMDAIGELASRHGVLVIEDCAQAHGASYRGKQVGCLGDIAAFSFCTDKIITTAGEGGMITTDDAAAWRRAWEYKDHGKDHGLANQVGDGTFRWVHSSFGSNYRLTEVQSSIGRIQLAALDESVAARRRNASVLAENLADVPGLIFPLVPDDVAPSWYRYYVRLDRGMLAGEWTRDGVVKAMLAQGVPCQSGSCAEVYRELAFKRANIAAPERLPNAAEWQEGGIALQVHPLLGPEHMRRTAAVLTDVMIQATGDRS